MLLNYTNVSRETGVSSKVIRNYFQILEEECGPMPQYLISFEKEDKKIAKNIQCLFWKNFFDKLWAGEII